MKFVWVIVLVLAPAFAAANDKTPISTDRVALVIGDPVFDAEIEEMIRSDQLQNKVFCYKLGDEKYQVRVIYNPTDFPLQASETFQFRSPYNFFSLYRLAFTLDWNKKYGIFIDREAPSELIHHITDRLMVSWNDFFFNSKIYNGSVVYFFSGNTQYSTITWFEYMGKAELVSSK